MFRLLAAAVSVLLPAHAGADELQNRLVAGARATDTSGHAFRQTITATGIGVGNKSYVTAYDPRRAAADRWQLVSIDGRTPTARELEKSRKAKRDAVPAYAELAKWLAAPATRADGANGTVTYHYASLPAGTVKLGSHDASADTAADVVVNTRGGAPYVERVRFTSTRGFRMMLVASVKSMAFVSRYRRLPDGQMAPADMASAITGSMMGKSGELRSTVTFSDWQKVR
ncbi:hypothetical protein M9979_00895 [Sphingomonas sp. RP10(2022)]|uniref:DUF3108 domain-containing protein n=1 Tax=Sphingomonas liriopis TaxID=2949094 RepID=A0A9X2HNH1_9SPHN|nr:hypothetical protein [Sphingomonas liriopis]MCP3733442.1 hypothetical protein [Sphingomonas liriopis]